MLAGHPLNARPSATIIVTITVDLINRIISTSLSIGIVQAELV